MPSELSESFYSLSPEGILNALESIGFTCTGRCLQLNSLENRVFEIQLETQSAEQYGEKVVSKFYRPARWSQEQIQEEHDFLFDLHAQEIPVICPIAVNGQSLFTCPDTGIFFCVFPKFGGRNLDEFSDEQARSLGRIIARIHLVGAQGLESNRLTLDIDSFGEAKLDYLIDHDVVPEDIRPAFISSLESFYDLAAPFFDGISFLKIHGDAHVGNILNRDGDFFFVDFDDMLIGPAVQDLWLLATGRDSYSRKKLQCVLEGYQDLRSFDTRELFLIEPLRTLRVVHFTTWIHQRWDDQSFRKTFDQFNSDSYWREQLQFLYEQISAFQQLVSCGEPLAVVD